MANNKILNEDELKKVNGGFFETNEGKYYFYGGEQFREFHPDTCDEEVYDVTVHTEAGPDEYVICNLTRIYADGSSKIFPNTKVRADTLVALAKK